MPFGLNQSQSDEKPSSSGKKTRRALSSHQREITAKKIQVERALGFELGEIWGCACKKIQGSLELATNKDVTESREKLDSLINLLKLDAFSARNPPFQHFASLRPFCPKTTMSSRGRTGQRKRRQTRAQGNQEVNENTKGPGNEAQHKLSPNSDLPSQNNFSNNDGNPDQPVNRKKTVSAPKRPKRHSKKILQFPGKSQGSKRTENQSKLQGDSTTTTEATKHLPHQEHGSGESKQSPDANKIGNDETRHVDPLGSLTSPSQENLLFDKRKVVKRSLRLDLTPAKIVKELTKLESVEAFLTKMSNVYESTDWFSHHSSTSLLYIPDEITSFKDVVCPGPLKVTSRMICKSWLLSTEPPPNTGKIVEFVENFYRLTDFKDGTQDLAFIDIVKPEVVLASSGSDLELSYSICYSITPAEIINASHLPELGLVSKSDSAKPSLKIEDKLTEVKLQQQRITYPELYCSVNFVEESEPCLPEQPGHNNLSLCGDLGSPIGENPSLSLKQAYNIVAPSIKPPLLICDPSVPTDQDVSSALLTENSSISEIPPASNAATSEPTSHQHASCQTTRSCRPTQAEIRRMSALLFVGNCLVLSAVFLAKGFDSTLGQGDWASIGGAASALLTFVSLSFCRRPSAR
ncbi:unnamed protein product [Mesocestoides corti]|uniref:Death domain-containing protein n=1 Tax=Mesocestoides corti TaxID=53468 RepID=A0A0R3UNN5_MESCO|nr:unnamed protein product [Mesocestoides corti]